MENNDNKVIQGTIDPELINIHMKAASKDDMRKAIKCLLMKKKGRFLHLITTDGRMLLHTTVSELVSNLEGAPDFEIMVDVTRKLKKGHKDTPKILFTIEGDKVFFRGYNTFDAFEIYKDGTYPNVADVECNDKSKVAESDFQPIMPDILDIIYDYIGRESYSNPLKVADAVNRCRPQFYMRNDAEENRLAIAMPILILGNPTNH